MDNNNNCINRWSEVKEELGFIIKCLKLDLAIWRTCHRIGLQIVISISNICTKCLTLEKNRQNLKKARQISSATTKLAKLKRELKSPLERLSKILEKLENANERTRTCLKQLRQMRKMKEFQNAIICHSWSLENLLQFVETVMRLYDAEYEIKEMVMEDIATLKSYEEFRIFRTFWQIPRHALTREFNEKFDEFNYETNVLAFLR